MADKEKKKKRSSFVARFFQGRWFSTAFFIKNAIILVSALVFLMIYISNKYQVQTKIELIQTLEQDLERVKTESVRERSIYMSRTRESSMQHMIDTMSLGLQIKEQPPYVISYTKRQ